MKFFSYGIFMDGYLPRKGKEVGRMDGTYATVQGWKTVGDYIVMAVPDDRATLTGVVFDIDDVTLRAIDKIEAGYKRISVTTTMGVRAWMYVKP